MKSKQKGRQTEKQFKDVFLLNMMCFQEEQIEQARPTYKPIGNGRIISSQNDLFQKFDFMVKSQIFDMYIQVKSNPSHATEAVHDIREWADLYGNPDKDKFLVAQKVTRKGFILRYIEHDPKLKSYIITRKKYVNLKGEFIDKFKQS